MRLHELHINNFKFFQKQEVDSPLLKIEGKNLLIYGENGSGKSTIYWAIYTLLESAFKAKNEEITKYFTKKGDFSLVNIYARSKHNSHIKMVLKDETGHANEFYLDGERETIEKIRTNANVKESNMASDFLNYKVLFSLHNAKHSTGINLFQWFEEQIFPYIRVKEIDINRSVKEVFEELKKGPEKVKSFDEIDEEIFPNPSMKDDEREAVKKDYKKYEKYQISVNRWNRELKKYLNQIAKEANEILEQNFKQNFEIKLDYHPLKINVTEKEPEIIDHPSIELKIPIYNGKRNVVKKPHTFLNEAKLAAIGLSIRFAILSDWTNRPNTALFKILVIDDLILSLDMGNRDIVLNLLLDDYAKDYQIILMTHDRYFFELTQGKINARNKGGDWLKLEMYEDIENGKAKPLVLKSKTNLERAKSFFKQKEFAASANHLRKATECFVHEYVPKKHHYNKRFERLNLSQLINKSRVCARANGLPATLIQDLDLMRTHIFNPGSHYGIYIPIFQNDLKRAIETLEQVSRLTNINL